VAEQVFQGLVVEALHLRLHLGDLLAVGGFLFQGAGIRLGGVESGAQGGQLSRTVASGRLTLFPRGFGIEALGIGQAIGRAPQRNAHHTAHRPGVAAVAGAQVVGITGVQGQAGPQRAARFLGLGAGRCLACLGDAGGQGCVTGRLPGRDGGGG